MKTEIQNIIEIFIENMLSKNTEKINSVLHNDVIFFSPDYTNVLKGKNECINSINEYHKIADTLEFRIEKTEIIEWQNTANVKLEYYIEYQIDSKLYKEYGTEFWTLSIDNGKWFLVSRLLLKTEEI